MFNRQGHSTPVHGISFSPNGKLIASLAAQENQISFWQPSSGFLDSLKGAFGTQSQPHVSLPIGAGKMKPYRTFPIGKPNNTVDIQQVVDCVRFDWTGERSLRMYPVSVELAFSI